MELRTLRTAPYNRRMLLGRDRERHELEAALAGARLNRSAILVVAGEVGIGKTTLLEDAAERARAAGMRVLRARGIESEARVPFAGLLELLRPALAALERIPEPQRAALEGALALRPVDRAGSLRRRRGDAQPARGARRGVRRSLRSSTTPTGSTDRARTRCCSRCAG